MNVEDSYEGAARRLRRLELAGIDLDAPPSVVTDEGSDRMRELEELATLACEENERLTREVDSAREELDRARQELDGAHRELDRLRGVVATLQQTVAGTSFGAEDVPYPYPPKSNGKGAAFYFFIIAIVGAGAVALGVLRPWDRPIVAPVVVEQVATATPPSAPVVTAPPPIVPKIEPPAPKVEPVIPKAAPRPTASRVEAPAVKAKPQRQHAKHHAAKAHRHESSKSGAAARAKESAVPETNDPLGGVNL